MKSTPRILISGGGTGGHIFPALSIANAIKSIEPQADIRFVGAENRMEMERVPAEGYPIVGLPVAGFDRKRIWRNFGVLIKLFRSLRKASQMIAEFQPDIAVGVGGYASGPTLWMAARKGIPTIIQEQNSYAGITNKLLARRAKRIFVAYEGMDRFFAPEKIEISGNPVRQSLFNPAISHQQAAEFFGLDAQKPILLIIGGSLGARQINESVAGYLETATQPPVQIIWQTGKAFDAKAKQLLTEKRISGVQQMAFIARMDMAYQAADLVISRAGASSISELSLLGKAAILVPSPNVAEDHQTKNAQALVGKGAALMVRDSDAPLQLMPLALQMMRKPEILQEIAQAIGKMAYPDSAKQIARYILESIV